MRSVMNTSGARRLLSPGIGIILVGVGRRFFCNNLRLANEVRHRSSTAGLVNR